MSVVSVVACLPALPACLRVSQSESHPLIDFTGRLEMTLVPPPLSEISNRFPFSLPVA